MYWIPCAVSGMIQAFYSWTTPLSPIKVIFPFHEYRNWVLKGKTMGTATLTVRNPLCEGRYWLLGVQTSATRQRQPHGNRRESSVSSAVEAEESVTDNVGTKLYGIGIYIKQPSKCLQCPKCSVQHLLQCFVQMRLSWGMLTLRGGRKKMYWWLKNHLFE